MIYTFLLWFIVMIITKNLNDRLNIKFGCYPGQNLCTESIKKAGLFWPLANTSI